MQYQIVTAPTPTTLMPVVQALIDAGWAPLGGPFATGSGQVGQALTM